MNRKNLAIRALSVFLSVLMLVCMVPITMSVDATATTTSKSVPVAIGTATNGGLKVTEGGDYTLSTVGATSTTEGYATVVSKGTKVTDSGGRVTFSFTNDKTFSEAHFVKIKYKTNAKSNAYIAPRLGGKRTWDSEFYTFTRDGEWHEAVIDLSTCNYLGGESNFDTILKGDAASDAAALADLKISGILFRPFGNTGTTPASGEYFYVEYVALFGTKAEADAFVYAPTKVKFVVDASTCSTTLVASDTPTLTYPTTDPTEPSDKIFKGWDKAEGTALELCTENVVNAEWADAVTLTFMSGSTVLHYAKVEKGKGFDTSDADLKAAVDKYCAENNKIFKEWSSIPSSITTSTTINGTFKDAYVVTFKVNGETYKTVPYEGGTALAYPDAPTAENCKALGNDKFVSWDVAAGTTVNSSLTVTANVDEYVEIVINDADGKKLASYDIKKGEGIDELPAAVYKKGHTFLGFFDKDNNEIKLGDTVTADGTYTAKYKENAGSDINVVFMADPAGTKNAAAHYIYATNTLDTLANVVKNADFADPTLVGYTFKEWNYDGATGITASTGYMDAKLYDIIDDGVEEILIYPVYDAITAWAPAEPTIPNLSVVLNTIDGLSGTVGGNVKLTGKVGGYLVFTTDGSEESCADDNDRANVYFASTPKLADTPVMKIAYSATGVGTSTEINLYTSKGRAWGPYIAFENGPDKTVTVDLSKLSYSGGEFTGANNWANVKEANLTGLLFRPFSKATTGIDLQIKWVAFFADETTANAFTGEFVTIEVDGENVNIPGGLKYTLPTADKVAGKTFKNYVVNGGTYNNVVFAAGAKIDVADGITVTPVYEDAAEFEIMFVSGSTELATITVANGAELDLDAYDEAAQDAAAAGQKFTGWYKYGTRVLVKSGYVAEEDLVLVASYDLEYFTVTYKDATGKIVAVDSVKNGDEFDLIGAPAYELKGTNTIAKFVGWKDANGVLYTGSVKATNNFVFTANFVEFKQTESAPLTLLMGILKKITADKLSAASGSDTGSTPSTSVAGEGPVAVFDADALADSNGGGGITAEAKTEDGKSFIRFIANDEIEMADNVRNNIVLDSAIAAEFTAKDAPFVKIGYRLNKGLTNLDLNPKFASGEDTARLWGTYASQKVDDKWNTLVFDLSSGNYSGGEGALVTGNSAAERFAGVADAHYTGFCMKPFETNGNAIKAGSYYDVEYVAYFKTKADADAYVFGAEASDDDAKEEVKDDAKEKTKTDVAAKSEGALAVFTADQLTASAGGGYAAELKGDVLHLTTGEAAAVNDGTRFAVNFDNTLTIAEAPIIKIGYKAKTDSVNFSIHVNGARLWDNALKVKADGKSQTLVYDISTINFIGGEGDWDSLLKGDEKADFAAVKDTTLTGLLIRPFGSINADFYFDIEYVALFATVDAADAYNA